MISRVYLDLHGVLVRFVEPWAEVSGVQLPDPWPPGVYSLEEACGLQGGIWSQLLRRSSVEWWRDLPKTDELADVIRIATAIASWQIVTSASSPLAIRDHETAGSTRLVADVFGSAVEVIGRKADLARPDRLLIDDSDHQVDAWRREGGRAVLLPRPWNSEHRFAGDPIGRLQQLIAQLSTPAGGSLIVDLPLPPPAIDPNRKTTLHRHFRSAVRRYRETCEAIVTSQLRQLRLPPPRWTSYRIATTWRTESGRRRDWTNAIAAMKPAEDALQRAGVIANDVETHWERPTFVRASSVAATGIRVVVTSCD